MAKTKVKPKHSLDANRTDGKAGTRTASTVRRLKMYNVRPKRNRKGKILKEELQSKELPDTRIHSCRGMFGLYIFLHDLSFNLIEKLSLCLMDVDNSRVINQEQLKRFRDELQTRMSSSFNVILKGKKLPFSLLNDHQKVPSVLFSLL